jgi:hypothetical protein
MRHFVLTLLVVAIAVSCENTVTDYRATANNPEFLHRSMKEITDRIVHDIFSPPVASRIYAYTSVAAYEAIINENPAFVSLAGQLHGLTPPPKPDTSLVYMFNLSATQAMLKVGRALVFSEDMMDVVIEQIMADFKATGIPDDVFRRSVDYGNRVADHILAWSGGDNYKQSRSFPKYSIERNDATWKPTPPAYMDAIEPHWNKIRPFVIDSAGQFKPAPPTPFSTNKNSPFFKEVLEVLSVGKNLTEEQKEIAAFWDCNPFVMNVKGHVMFATKKISPGGHWINITREACTYQKTGPVETAEAYVRVALSLADGFISCWDEKYRSRLVRPETFINQHLDENWVPFLQTPPFPEYTSGHSVVSGAAAEALTDLFGDNFAFTDSTEVEYGMGVRSFSSFQAAAEEASESRVYGGIHYRPAIEHGLQQGRAVGVFIRKRLKTRRIVEM